jgi:bifunctional oligoribonuclease and PAP phosphatase NrnA
MTTASKEADHFLELLDSSSRILVITHISPDPDALCSLLLTGTTLRANYPDKNITMSSEELTGGLDFLAGYADIRLQALAEAVDSHQPDLIIMLDAMNFQRCTRGDSQAVADKVRATGIKLAIIDHHQPEGVEPSDLYINHDSPAATQDVYELFFNQMGMRKPDGYAQTAMLGIVSDTNRFMYDNPRHRDTFAVVDDLLDAGASIEELENKRNRFTKNQMLVLAELAANVTLKKDFTYSYISDDFKDQWYSSGKTPEELKLGCQIFVNEYTRNIGTNRWGFLVYPDLLGGPSVYSVSFRSVSGAKDVAEIAKRLGGGGHKASAGAKFEATSLNQALKRVIEAIGA